jgi:Mn-dependent DtxR family transcriptional regulator
MKTRDQKLLQIAHLLSEEHGLSQRDIFLRLGMAQGLVNRYLKLLARKGWIKLTTAPAKRMRYWMTAKGMREKSRLVYDFVTSNYRLFREAHRGASNALHVMAEQGARRIAFHGGGPLAEIAAMSLRENQQTLVAVIDDGIAEPTHLGAPVTTLKRLREIGCDGLLLIRPLDRRARAGLSRSLVVEAVLADGAEAP